MKAQAGAFGTITSNLGRLNRDELVEVAAMVAGLLEALDDDHDTASGNGHASTTGPTPGPKNGKRGHIEYKTINGCGPYAYLRYWSGKTLKSHYLGKVKKEGEA